MTREVAPRLPAAPPPRIPFAALAGAGVASLAAAALFWSPLCLGGALRAGDWSSHHYHYFDWVRISLVEHGALPLYMADAWVTPNFVANAESPVLSPLSVLLALLPTDAFLKLWIVAHGAVGLLGAWLLLRDLGASALPAALVAVAFSFGGFFVSHVAMGHPWALGGQLLPALFFLYRRATLGSGRALVCAAFAIAWVPLSGQHQPFVWQSLLLGAFASLWSLRARSALPLLRLALIALLAAGISAAKLLPMVVEFADYAPEARIAALPPQLLPLALAGKGQDPEWSPTAIRYQHGAGWWEYAFYLGTPALACLAVGLAAARRVWPIALPGLAFALLALQWAPGGEPSGPWRLVQDLPVWRTQRAPSRFLLPALFCLLVAAGPGLERLHRAARRRFGRAARLAAGALLAAVLLDLFAASLSWQRAAVGPPIASRDHWPRPLVVSGSGTARARLAAFAPNRLAYAVEAEGPARIVLPLRFGPRSAEWDAGPLPVRAERGRVAVDVPAGVREVALRYRPPRLREGAAISAATLLVVAVEVARRRRAGRTAR